MMSFVGRKKLVKHFAKTWRGGAMNGREIKSIMVRITEQIIPLKKYIKVVSKLEWIKLTQLDEIKS
jgi:hypothetical protein